MQKVIYYDRFFQRVGANLPPEVVDTARRLFARCYEYRDEIRDELESSLAYVADAGRWVIGMEDWNSKMEKRLVQISELVLLANTLLVEYSLTGKWGAEGAKNELSGYLRSIASSVVLRNDTSSERTARPPVAPPVVASDAPKKDSGEAAAEAPSTPTTSTSPETIQRQESGESVAASSTSSGDSPPSSAGLSSTTRLVSSPTERPVEECSPCAALPAAPQDDDDCLNPFASTYQPPLSIESSLASLSETGSVLMANPSTTVSELIATNEAGEDEAPDSPVSLGEYECLELDSIPQYVAFKPSTLSRKRRLKQRQQAPISPTNGSGIAQQCSVPRLSPAGSPLRSPSSVSSSHSSLTGSRIKQRQALMDLSYSYDLQREMECNPFASPEMLVLNAMCSEGSNSNLSAVCEDDVPALQLPPSRDVSDSTLSAYIRDDAVVDDQYFSRTTNEPLELPENEGISA
ncbi:hypothetical protein PINS_up012048 [Pythium insidiosum]|nr:hypothetical protein PINS_up012048 [Pythium insidiosum]